MCDVAENCTGTSAACPSDTFVSSSTVCRGAVDICDVAENCTGSSPACPADGYADGSTTCRASTGPCDLTEYCTGTSTSCPGDTIRSDGSPCGGGNTCYNGACCSANIGQTCHWDTYDHQDPPTGACTVDMSSWCTLPSIWMGNLHQQLLSTAHAPDNTDACGDSTSDCVVPPGAPNGCTYVTCGWYLQHTGTYQCDGTCQ
jgi:hypothetical protein